MHHEHMCLFWMTGRKLLIFQQYGESKGWQSSIVFSFFIQKSFQIDELDNANVLMRGSFGRLNRGASTLVVTYPDAICEKWLLDITSRKIPLKCGWERRYPWNLSQSFCFITILRMWFRCSGRRIFCSWRNSGHLFIRFWTSLSHRIFWWWCGEHPTLIPLPAFGAVDESHYHNAERAEKLLEESFLWFHPPSAVVWFKDMSAALSYLEQQFNKTKEQICKQKLIHQKIWIWFWYEWRTCFKAGEISCSRICRRFYYPNGESFHLTLLPQPSFNKNFNLLIENLQKNQEQGIKIFCSWILPTDRTIVCHLRRPRKKKKIAFRIRWNSQHCIYPCMKDL